MINDNGETGPMQVFVGAALSKGSEGMNQKTQLARTIEDSKRQNHNVLVAGFLWRRGPSP